MNVRQTALESAEQQPATSFAALCKPALLQGCVLLIAVIYVLVNGLTDLAYGWIDPRVRRP
jgi:ABC-type dipeptide/oligopeptide/nickel transport system permease component